MADRDAILLPLRPALVPVPAAGQLGICPICLSSRNDDFATCYPCSQAGYLDPPSILPVTMSVAGGAVHHHLRMYKDSGNAQARERLALRLAALLALFMENHSTCVGEWDVATCVPSPARVAMAPVVAKLKRFDRRHEQLLRSRAGTGDRTLDPDQFEVLQAAVGQRVLVLDDTFTTGAKLFSAVAALRRAGAEVVGPVVLGRHVQTSWGPSAEMMSWLEGRAWDEGRCARCGGERRDEGALF